MSFTVDVVREARRRLQTARNDKASAAELARARAYQAQPRLRELDIQLRATVAQTMAAAFKSRSDPTEAVARAKAQNQAAQAERSRILHRLMLPDYLDEAPYCTQCDGSGYRGSVMCECLKAICREVQMEQLRDLPGENVPGFDSFRLSVYSAVKNNHEIAPRELMVGALEDAQAWTANFPNGDQALLFSGGTGLGKTLLAACIARTLTARNVGVVFTSVNMLLRDYESAKFGGIVDATRRYEEAELLVIDDLGTEMSTQFTNSALYSIISTRLERRKPMILTTNLQSEVLQQRYPPQLISRLLGAFVTYVFIGNDLRML